jgi:hypothetical protein
VSYPNWPEIVVALAAVVQAGLAFAIWRATRTQADVETSNLRLQEAIHEARGRVELVPIIESTPDPAPSTSLSIGNAALNGCRVVRVKLVMERAAPRKEEEERRLDHVCSIPGNGIIQGFGDLRIDLAQPVRELLRAVAFVPGEPGSQIVSQTYTVRLWVIVDHVVNQKRSSTESVRYLAHPQARNPTEPPTSLGNLELDRGNEP